jgi:hypothetical protein
MEEWFLIIKGGLVYIDVSTDDHRSVVRNNFPLQEIIAHIDYSGQYQNPMLLRHCMAHSWSGIPTYLPLLSNSKYRSC